MKKYVMITNGISGYGGGKLYIRNKKTFMESQGWKVYVFSAWNKEVKIPELEPYVDIGFEEIVQPVSKYSKQFVNSKLDYMSDIIGGFEECVIESSEITCATWGELLAKKLQAKHIIFLIVEGVEHESVRYRQFGEFKLKRGEFRACHNSTVMQFFEKGKYSLEESKKYYLTAPITYGTYCNERSEFEELIDSSKLVLCVFSRLDKPFVKTVFLELKKYFEHNLKVKTQILVIGTGNRFTDVDIKSMFQGLTNVELIFTGHLQPVPAGLLQKTDIIFATAGCATMARLCKCVVASIDVEDHGVIGIAGVNTDNTTYRSTEPYQSIESFLCENIKNIDNYKVLIQKDRMEIGALEEAFQPHLDWVFQTQNNSEYYDEKQMFKIGGLRTKAIRLLNCLAGDRYK